MFKGNEYNYFDLFVKLVGYSYQASDMLSDMIKKFNPSHISVMMEEMHKIEHGADIEIHNMKKHLTKEFITPIDREDILNIAYTIDDITDCIEDVLIKAYMFNILRMPPKSMDFAVIISKSCETLKKLTTEFSNFKKSDKVYKYISEVKSLEEDGDRVYKMAVRNLYTGRFEESHLLAYTEIYECLEECNDACEHASEMIESVIMKNI